MAVIAAGMITLSFERDILANYRYYKLQSSTATPPTKPTSIATLPPSGWTDTEPTYTEGSTNTLYMVDLTTYSDGTFYYTPVLKSSSYEAAKSAYNKAVAAQNTANAAQESIDNLEIGGRNLIINTLYPDVSTNDSRPRILGQTTYTGCRSANVTVAEHGIRTTNGAGVTGYPYIRFGNSSGSDISMNGLVAGETYTFSSDITWKTLSNYTSATVRKMQISVYVMKEGETSFSHLSTGTVETITPGVEQSKRGVHTFTLPEDTTAVYIIIRDSAASSSSSSEGDFLELANIKLEKGNKATDWTPAPEDTNKAITDAKILYAESSTDAATAEKVATITPAVDNFELQVGTMLHVKFSETNSAAVANLKLNVNSTGAKPIKYFSNTSNQDLPGVSYLAKDILYTFTYDGTNWVVAIDRNTNDNYYDRIRFQVAITAKSAIVAKNIIVAGSDGKYFHLKSNKAFDVTYPILYANSAIAANATGTNNYLAFYFAIATTQALTLTANKAVYIKGTLNNNLFTPVSTAPLTQTVPTSVDGYKYIRLGFAYSTTSIYMDTDHSIYEYNNGGFKTTSQIADEARERVQAMFNNLNGVDQFNALTQNGALNGIFYSDNGDTYINAAFIKTGTLAADKIAVTDLQAFGATIGGFDVDTTSIHTHNVAVTSNAENSVALSSDAFTRTLDGVERANLKLAIGANFGVGKDGTLYATNGVFTGTIYGSTVAGSVVTFTQGSGQITAEASTWELTRSGVVVETVQGVLFHGNGGFGVNARDISLDSSDTISINSTGTTGSVITHIEASNNTYRSFADFYSNVVIQSALVSDSVSYNGRLVLNPTTGSTYLYGSKHIELAADDGTVLIRASGIDTNTYSRMEMGYDYIRLSTTDMQISGALKLSNSTKITTSNNGHIGYVGGIDSSKTLGDYWTQGQYSVSGATGRPAKSSAYGILLSFMGNANEDIYTDDYSHSWGLQLYSDNEQLYYRTKTKAGPSTWRSTWTVMKDFNIKLNSLTWNTTGAGMYYSSAIMDTDEASHWDHIDSVSLNGAWSNIRKTDFIIPYVSGTNIYLMSNVNSFYNANSAIGIRVAGRRGASTS